ncbi:nitroimidazol reductase NimA-like FMN-containing flavoprotein (pyridoxamine 5'-phosphate oxidase superfamily) [Georgenia soli]|uniref:Nitroimidazol reductase NimA-like FMN-containing flavoprotein (Pyridoxamine 5'-phosphate oxidase superfamily) n=1 Tax=Georgenia soli TaxID=638953 RepID=A0A2A9ESI0_9MICO|nr:pyridoxamine 5'-phosphate oxidase family protein [Georgenia soli]PFG41159.1 nitroimidazol reductase NimA-like FMN-containing flavoprotein (pyridoxamine 5'-phosphate oxidase superfamily) [Georgenia soli]
MGFDAERQVTMLDEDECWRLLEAKDLGRLAVSVQDQPDIFPINYATSRRRLYLRTAQGSKLLELTINSHVALEIDDIGTDSAVSVVVQGTARQLEAEAETEAAEQLHLRPRVGDGKPVFVEITPVNVEGRRFHLPPESEEPE